jgi:hypothetical protein
MRKLYKYLLIALILGCSSDDNNVSKTQLKIEHFNITVSEITESSAQISWNITEVGIEEGVSENNLRYDIYLDDSLVIENISQNGYTLENLDFDTEYSCELIVKESSNNQVEIPFEFETILEYSNYYPLEVGNIWYYELHNIDPFQQDAWQITERIISTEIFDNKENFLIEQKKLWYYHYSNGTQTTPCSTTITHFHLRFEDDILIKRNSSSEESIVIDFNEIPSGSVIITEECDVPFYTITSCVYERREEFGGYGEIYRYMHQIGKIMRYASDGTATSNLELIGFKPVNSVLIGSEHNIVCD